MTTGSPPLLIRFGDDEPEIAPDAWIASGAAVIGRVSLGSRASVWYGSVLRADGDAIQIGAVSNVQDGCVIHADPPAFPSCWAAGCRSGTAPCCSRGHRCRQDHSSQACPAGYAGSSVTLSSSSYGTTHANTRSRRASTLMPFRARRRIGSGDPATVIRVLR